MEHIVRGLSIVFARKDSHNVAILVTILFFLILLAVQNGKEASQVFSFDTLSTYEQIVLFIGTFFDIKNTFTASTLIISVLGSLLGGINISLAYTYITIRGEIILRSGLYSGLGLFFAFVGIGCAACGTALLSVILSFFGLSTMLKLLPYQGEELGYIGIIFLCIATYTLAKRISAPATC